MLHYSLISIASSLFSTRSSGTICKRQVVDLALKWVGQVGESILSYGGYCAKSKKSGDEILLAT